MIMICEPRQIAAPNAAAFHRFCVDGNPRRIIQQALTTVRSNECSAQINLSFSHLLTFNFIAARLRTAAITPAAAGADNTVHA